MKNKLLLKDIEYKFITYKYLSTIKQNVFFHLIWKNYITYTNYIPKYLQTFKKYAPIFKKKLHTYNIFTLNCLCVLSFLLFIITFLCEFQRKLYRNNDMHIYSDRSSLSYQTIYMSPPIISVFVIYLPWHIQTFLFHLCIYWYNTITDINHISD